MYVLRGGVRHAWALSALLPGTVGVAVGALARGPWPVGANPGQLTHKFVFVARKFRNPLTLRQALLLTNLQKVCMGLYKTLTKSFPQKHFLFIFENFVQKRSVDT